MLSDVWVESSESIYSELYQKLGLKTGRGVEIWDGFERVVSVKVGVIEKWTVRWSKLSAHRGKKRFFKTKVYCVWLFEICLNILFLKSCVIRCFVAYYYFCAFIVLQKVYFDKSVRCFVTSVSLVNCVNVMKLWL